MIFWVCNENKKHEIEENEDKSERYSMLGRKGMKYD